MTKPTNQSMEQLEAMRREHQVLRNIRAMLNVHHRLSDFAERLQISIERQAVVLRGNVPTDSVKQAIVPAIRQTGVMWQVWNRVEVA